jgi:hypothetical protein
LHPLHASGAAVRRKKITSAYDGGVMLLAFADTHRTQLCERNERAVLGLPGNRFLAPIISGGGFHPESGLVG